MKVQVTANGVCRDGKTTFNDIKIKTREGVEIVLNEEDAEILKETLLGVQVSMTFFKKIETASDYYDSCKNYTFNYLSE
jgi:hypothetical protein